MPNTRILTPGTILNDKYVIEELLGEGGFGITYRAKDISINEYVAIKEYFPAILGTRDNSTVEMTNEITLISGAEVEAFEKGLNKFREEAVNLAKFNKEAGIVSVKNYFSENNTGYMVMEYVEGISLKEYLKQNGGKIPVDKAMSLIKPVMDSLEVIHKASIIHRDISPDNIMVTSEGQTKLIDFGAARFVEAENEKSLTVLIKPGYAPPEQYQTNGKQGSWTDIYALCATIYRMISGDSPIESVERVLGNDSVISLDKRCPGVPKYIAKAISKGMNPDVSQRYHSVEELKKDLNREGKVRNKVLLGAVAALVILCVGAGAFYILNDSKSVEKVIEEPVVEQESLVEELPEIIDTEEEFVEEIIEVVEEEVQEYVRLTKSAELRTSPDTEVEDNIIAYVQRGTRFLVEEKQDAWLKVSYGDEEGYIQNEHVISANSDAFDQTKHLINILAENGILNDRYYYSEIEDDLNGDGAKEWVGLLVYEAKVKNIYKEKGDNIQTGYVELWYGDGNEYNKVYCNESNSIELLQAGTYNDKNNMNIVESENGRFIVLHEEKYKKQKSGELFSLLSFSMARERYNRIFACGQDGIALVYESIDDTEEKWDSFIFEEEEFWTDGVVVITQKENENWKTLIDKVNEMVDGKIKYHTGVMNDFDNDGEQELFVINNLAEKGKGKVIVYYLNGEELSTLDEVEVQKPTVDIVAGQFGKQTVCLLSIISMEESGGVFYKHYCINETGIVSREVPEGIILNSKNGNMYFNIGLECSLYGPERMTHDEFLYLDGYTIPAFYLDGKLGEIKSKEITIEDFHAVEGAEDILEEISKRMNTKHYGGFIAVGESDSLYIEIAESEIDNIMYNDNGYFVINYYCTYKRNGKADAYPMGRSLFIPLDSLDYGKDIVAIDMFAIIKYEEGMLSIEDISFGRIKESSGQFEILAESTWGK